MPPGPRPKYIGSSRPDANFPEMSEDPSREEIVEAYTKLQDFICKEMEETDGEGSFREDVWARPGGGGGRTRILESGAILEKAGVNFSAVEGDLSPTMIQSLGVSAGEFFATGVSIVMHPSHPLVPIIHMNIRYFETEGGAYWFGGGIDLTPHFIVKSEAAYFHLEVKRICDRYNPEFYPRFKRAADDYFFLSHRNETRGVGGIFYDHLQAGEGCSKRDLLEFGLDIGRKFPEIYTWLIAENRDKIFTDAEKKWQLLRRGRYVEFNLIHDRGTRFGLTSNGRTESILMSLPETAKWVYDYRPQNGGPEALTQEWLRKGVDWIDLGTSVGGK